MLNELLPHESDFQSWVDSGFLPCSDETLKYLHFLANPEDESKPRDGGLWTHQWEAFLRIVYAREVLKRDFYGDGLLLNIVTGGGKTALIATVMVWLRLAYNVQRSLVLCPNLIVRDRLESDFKGGKVFIERGLIPPDADFNAQHFALTTLGGQSSATHMDLLGSNVVLSNIHQFYRSSKAGQANLEAIFGETGLKFAIFNDEAHNSPAPEYYRTLSELQDRPDFEFRLDTTATPDRADGKPIDSKMIYEYDIPQARQDEIIAVPVVYKPNIETVELTYTDAETGERRHVEEIDWDEIDKAGVSATQWVTDARPMSQQISIALNRLKEARRNANGRYNPILFVVAVSKIDANRAADMLRTEFKLKTLVVTEDENDDARKAATEIGTSGKYDAVVSVAMLREGWDVPEVSVVLLLRKVGSKVYGPQIVGRGLRRVRRDSIDPSEPQICAIVDHPKLDHDWLWELLRARVRDDVGIQQEFDEKEEIGEPPPVQTIVHPDKIIDIPEPRTVEPPTFGSVEVKRPPEPARDWMKLLDSIDYDFEIVEITNQEISSVTGEELIPGGLTSHSSAPKDFPWTDITLSEDDLREMVRSRVKEAAANLTDSAGYSLQNQRRVHRVLREHVEKYHLGGSAIDNADEQTLRKAAAGVYKMEHLLTSRTEIIGGMIEYGRD